MQNSDKYDINLMCECLNVSRSGFYRFFYASSGKMKEKKFSVCMRILSLHASDPFLGAPRITLLLHGEGIQIAQSTVSRYMKELGITAATTQKRFRPKRSKLSSDRSPAIVNRAKDAIINSPNTVWTTDITRMPYWQGLFLKESSSILIKVPSTVPRLLYSSSESTLSSSLLLHLVTLVMRMLLRRVSIPLSNGSAFAALFSRTLSMPKGSSSDGSGVITTIYALILH